MCHAGDDNVDTRIMKNSIDSSDYVSYSVQDDRGSFGESHRSDGDRSKQTKESVRDGESAGKRIRIRNREEERGFDYVIDCKKDVTKTDSEDGYVEREDQTLCD